KYSHKVLAISMLSPSARHKYRAAKDFIFPESPMRRYEYSFVSLKDISRCLIGVDPPPLGTKPERLPLTDKPNSICRIRVNALEPGSGLTLPATADVAKRPMRYFPQAFGDAVGTWREVQCPQADHLRP